MEAIKVVILEGNRAREVNHLGVMLMPYHHILRPNGYILKKELNQWQEAENNLREFEIEMPKFDYDFPQDGPTSDMLKSAEIDYEERIGKIATGSIHNAIILENGKVRIV